MIGGESSSSSTVLQMLKWFIGRSGNEAVTIGGTTIGEGVFVLAYVVLIVIIGIMLNQAFRPT